MSRRHTRILLLLATLQHLQRVFQIPTSKVSDAVRASADESAKCAAPRAACRATAHQRRANRGTSARITAHALVRANQALR